MKTISISRLVRPLASLGFAAAILCAAPSLAAPAIFEALAGTWSAEGKAFGADAKSRMEWAPSLGERFYRLEYQIVMNRDGKTQTFEGVGHYQPQSETAGRGFWADNSGDLHPIVLEIAADSLVSHWGVAGGKQGRTEYRLTSDGGVEVSDFLLTKDGWRPFNKTMFRKISD